MWFLILVGALVAALVAVFAVMDLRARRRGMRYQTDEARKQPNVFDADIARMRSHFQNGAGPGF
jgi:hypothetical protein